MTKKRAATIDERTDPSEGSNETFRVDRVYVPERTSSPSIAPAPRARASEPNIAVPAIPGDLERRVAELQRELDAARAKIGALEVRCAMLEGEANRHAIERLSYIAHLEEGLAMLGASEREDERSPLGDDDDD